MIIQSTKVWINETFESKQLRIEDGKIMDLLPYNHALVDLDVGDYWILPGFIDIHCHGYRGVNANLATESGLHMWNEALPKEGVTSYLLTTSTAPWEDLLMSFKILGQFIKSKPFSSEPLGIHIEGPFISPKFNGAQSEKHIVKPSSEAINELIEKSGNLVKMVAIAVEEDTDGQMQKTCIDQGILVAIGHSGATFNQVKEAVRRGASNFTHTFNGMNAFHHREIGVIGAAMRLSETYAEIIADGVHVDFDAVNILGVLKGKDKLIVVTDAVAIKGLDEGEYEFSDRKVTIGKDGCGYLKDGRLAGSSNKMNDMVSNLLYKAKLPIATAINAATKNPARLISARNKGEIAIGNDADIIVVNQEFEVFTTYSRGNCVFKKAGIVWK